MGMFSNVATAQVTGGGVYFEPGKYRVRVISTKIVRSQRGKGDFAIGEFEIVTSTNAARPAGSKASHVINMGNIMGPVNVKKFANAALGLNQDSEYHELEAAASELVGRVVNVEQLCEMIYDDKDELLAGVELDLEVVAITTQQGKPFNRHDWFPV